MSGTQLFISVDICSDGIDILINSDLIVHKT